MADEEAAADEQTAADEPTSGHVQTSGNDNVDADLNVVVSPGLEGTAAAFFSVKVKEEGHTLPSVSLAFRLVDEEGVETESLGGTTFNREGAEASGNAGLSIRIIPRIHQPQVVLSGIVNTAEGGEMFYFTKDIPV